MLRAGRKRKRHPRFSPFFLPVPCSTCQEARGQKSSGDTVGGSVFWTGQTGMENGPGKRSRCRTLSEGPALAACALHCCCWEMPLPSAASSWDAPRPHVHPRSGRELAYTHTQPEHGAFLGQMEMAFSITHHFGWIICTIASVHYWGEPGGVRTVLGVPG